MSMNLHVRSKVTKKEFDLKQTNTAVSYVCMAALKTNGLKGLLIAYEDAFTRTKFENELEWVSHTLWRKEHMVALLSFINDNYGHIEWYVT